MRDFLLLALERKPHLVTDARLPVINKTAIERIIDEVTEDEE